MAMLRKLKIHLGIIGVITVPKEDLPDFLKDFQLTLKNIIFLSITSLYGTYMIAVASDLMFKENAFSELSHDITFVIIGLVHCSFYYISFWKSSEFLAYMNDLENVIEKSVCLKKKPQFYL